VRKRGNVIKNKYYRKTRKTLKCQITVHLGSNRKAIRGIWKCSKGWIWIFQSLTTHLLNLLNMKESKPWLRASRMILRGRNWSKVLLSQPNPFKKEPNKLPWLRANMLMLKIGATMTVMKNKGNKSRLLPKKRNNQLKNLFNQNLLQSLKLLKVPNQKLWPNNNPRHNWNHKNELNQIQNKSWVANTWQLVTMVCTYATSKSTSSLYQSAKVS